MPTVRPHAAELFLNELPGLRRIYLRSGRQEQKDIAAGRLPFLHAHEEAFQELVPIMERIEARVRKETLDEVEREIKDSCNDEHALHPSDAGLGCSGDQTRDQRVVSGRTSRSGVN